jgi:hypothetical protein
MRTMTTEIILVWIGKAAATATLLAFCSLDRALKHCKLKRWPTRVHPIRT